MLTFGATALVLLQAGVMIVDEIYHRRRGLPYWESWGHAVDSLFFLIPMAIAGYAAYGSSTLAVYVAFAILSSIIVTKDEWIHARECTATEHWLHSLLFLIHPSVFFCFGMLWAEGAAPALRQLVPLLVFSVSVFQIFAAGRRRVYAPN